MPFEDDDVRWLAAILEEEGVDEIEVTDGDLRICVRARGATADDTRQVVAPPPEQAFPNEVQETPAASGVPVIAPMAGIFYHQPSPDAEPFVEQGDRVEAGDVVGLIEVMKLFNEITAPVSGVVSQLVVENEERVEADDPLMYLQPASREE